MNDVTELLKTNTHDAVRESQPGLGVTKAPFVNFSVSKIFDPVKVPVRLFASHSYLPGVTATPVKYECDTR